MWGVITFGVPKLHNVRQYVGVVVVVVVVAIIKLYLVQPGRI